MVDSGKPKHTPGPWELFHRSHGRNKWTIAILRGEKEVVAWSGFDGSDFQKAALANARLMAAAPELLKALEELMEILANTPLPTAVEGYARAAIRKAVGDGR